MPHKRAKRSVRDKARDERKADLPPSQTVFPRRGQASPKDQEIDSTGAFPKSAARVLNAEAVQTAWRKRKLEVDEGKDGGEGTKKKRKVPGGELAGREKDKAKNMKIKPGESLRHFNMRVEDDMRASVRSAMKNTVSLSKQKKSSSIREHEAQSAKKSKKSEVEAEDDAAPAEPSPQPTKEFARISSSAPRRLNDIAMAPPILNPGARLVRKTKSAADRGDSDDGVLSNAQKRMMELEREKAITRYRALKDARMKERDSGLGT